MRPIEETSATQLSTDQLITILQTALGVFRDEIDSDISAPRILTLLATIQNPGIPQADVAKVVEGLSQSGISRNVLDWSNLNSARKAGPDFVTQRPDPMFRKRNQLYPTAKGLEFISRLTGIVNGTYYEAARISRIDKTIAEDSQGGNRRRRG